MQFVKGSNNQAVICYGCNWKGDIFKAANHFEKMPVEGKEWVHNTIATLARRFSVDIGSIEISDEELRKIRLRQLTHHTNELLQELGITTEAEKRGLSPSTAREWGLLTIPDTAIFMDRLEKLGPYSEQLLTEWGLGHKRDGVWNSLVFGPKILTVSIRSSGGHTVGFSGRNLEFKKGDKFPKYKDVKKNEIFDKTGILYGLDKVLKSRTNSVYVFEGYLDTAIAHQFGVTNAVASMGTTLHPEQINLLQQASIHNLVICYDRDPNDAGWQAMDKIISSNFQGYNSLRVEILELPEGYNDPDEFLIKEGMDKFLALPKKSAFRWRMERRHANGQQLDSDFTQEMVNLIAMEPSVIFRSDMEKELAEYSSRPLKEIREAIRFILDKRADGYISAVENLKKAVVNKLRDAHGDTAISEIKIAANKANDLEKSFFSGESDTTASTIEMIDKTILTTSDKRPSLVFKTGIPMYDEIYEGIPKQDMLIGLLGNPSAGKSSFFTFLCKQLLQNNKDIAILFHSTDDAKPMVIRKIIATLSGVREIKIRNLTFQGEEKNRVFAAAAIVKEWLNDRKLEIRDASDGFELGYAENWIKQFRDSYPERPTIYMIDNFYKTSIDEVDRQKLEANINRLQLLTQIEHITAIATLEPKKTGDRPRLKLEDIKETKKVRQNIHIGWIIHNGSPSDGTPSEFITPTKTWNSTNGIKPMVEIQVAKYKDMPSGSVFYQFDYDTYTFKATEFISQQEMNKQAAQEAANNPKPYGGYQQGKSYGNNNNKMKPRHFDTEDDEDFE